MRASRCASCGRTAFPGAVPCPLCASDDAAWVELPSAGVVETYTTIGENTIGEVRLDDGTLVLGRLTLTEPAVGARVTLQEAGEVITFGV